MNSDTRNKLVVVALIVSMTLGVLVLGASQPARRAQMHLTAFDERTRIESVRIEFVPDLGLVDATAYNCKIFPREKQAEWVQQSADVRIAVVASRAGKLD